ncbi:S-layer homology domain-containing protein [Paenibacillus sp. S28]|uniref:S-layer homology domain-containing protein n=1 Tax=Paenibacillus sp. S28 TaxID=2767463 RepID=UPI001909A28C|nr:S-layer homology domain-containing protein [Paenibacillus sp. S28]MBJ9993027.1 S-layer homology domain-containing protein [Paenibacillus sp. S28]
MHRIKKTYVWIMLMALIVSLFPAGLAQPVHADPGAPATYFIPDDLVLRQTSLLTTDSSGNQINRTNVYVSSISTLDVTGVYSYVSENTLKAKVEQLSSKTLADGTIEWVTDPTHFKDGNIVADTSSTAQKFKANKLPLFSGFNKITFSGSQNGITRTDVFYVLYDQIPYVTDLKMTGTSLGEVPLNEGSEAVSDKEMISIQGEVRNATDVTVSVNNDATLTSTLLPSGKFFSSGLKLTQGLNVLTINIKNGSDTMSVTRNVYYYNKKSPFVSLNLNYNAKNYSLLNNVPTVTDGSTAGTGIGRLTSVVLVEDTGDTFSSKGIVTIDGNPPTNLTIDKDVPIPAPDGVTPAYRLVTISMDTPDMNTKTSYRLGVAYGNNSNSYDIAYKYMAGVIGIDDIKYLKGYDPSKGLGSASQLPLSEVDSSTFYILVKADQDLTGNPELQAEYVPSGQPIDVSYVYAGPSAAQKIYKVTGLSSGQQKVQFHFKDSSANYPATISYAIKNNIYIENVRNGQVYEMDSSNKKTINVKGEYRDFDKLEKAELFINGIASSNVGVTFDVTDANRKFDLDLTVDTEGPLYYGENKIKFVGYSKDGRGNTTTVYTELRIYIVDTNVANITVFRPTLSLETPPSFNGLDLTQLTDNSQLNEITANSPEFVYNNDKYETTQLKYSLVIQGSGAKYVNLNLGTQKFFASSSNSDIDLTDTKMQTTKIIRSSFQYNNQTLYYDMAILNGKFVLRINDIPFETLGSQVYNLELINSTGARANQRLELTRVAEAFRILSPKATVDNRIVVNKNFVRFDIEAEGADKVIIGKEEATKRQDMNNRFVLDYVGLKPDKNNTVKIQVVRGKDTITQSIDIYYTGAVAVNSEFMTEKPATKYTAFNKALSLSFPKGTVLTSANVNVGEVAKFYPDNKLLFGIADPKDGVVERKNDYGNVININKDDRTPQGNTVIPLAEDLLEPFTSMIANYNFTRVSDIYWISGGLGEHGNVNSADYIPPSNGLPPHAYEYQNTKYNFKESAELQPDRKIIPSQRGTLTLGFNKSVVDEAGTTVTVFRFTDDARWENVGGVVDTKNNTITVPFDDFGYYVVMKQSRGFDDITKHPWARNILNALYAKGIMVNVQSSVFGADDLTTRGEFATLLVKGLNIPLNFDKNVQTFFDVDPAAKTDTWDFEHIETAARAGIVTGIGEGNFGVFEPITREDAAVMVARAMKLKLAANDDKLKATLDKSFLDSGKIGIYARPAIVAVTKAKVMSGEAVTLPGQKKASYNFNPQGSMTRAEAGKIAVELFKKSSKIFPANLS